MFFPLVFFILSLVGLTSGQSFWLYIYMMWLTIDVALMSDVVDR